MPILKRIWEAVSPRDEAVILLVRANALTVHFASWTILAQIHEGNHGSTKVDCLEP